MTVLGDVKEDLGISTSVDAFDKTLIRLINSAFISISELGVKCNDTLLLNGLEAWEQCCDDENAIPLVKAYVYLKVRLTFDPPATSFVLQALTDQVSELEFRINVLVDSGN